MSDEIFGNLQDIVKDIKPSVEIVGETDTLKELGLDSLDTVNLFFDIEKAFDIKISEDDISDYDLVSIDKIVEYIRLKSSA